jgi:hypothetical protein
MLWLLALPFSILGIKVQTLDFMNSVKGLNRFGLAWSYDRNAWVHLHWNLVVLSLPLLVSDCSAFAVDDL